MPDPAPARHEIHVALRVTDEAGYRAYRDAMTPILESMGGFFRYDMRIAELLKGDAPEAVNRAFIISFPDKPTRERFFSDPAYRAVRDRHFDASVSSTVIIAEYDLS
tara:strand:+ start:6158 stop:6478 length:321 start_codon:yes stop_codon:yes gene_type:complete